VKIDVTFDFRKDSNSRDPDKYSPTLRRYHQLLWSKPLPIGKMFDLQMVPEKYLYHNSELGEFVLTSDSVLPTFSQYKSYQHIISQIPEDEVEEFVRETYTIGGMMIFPGNKVDGRMTINGARGCNPKIADRFDLTVECIRRYYHGEDSPLFNDLARYSDFFALFRDFKGYVDFFLLQDLVSADYSAVRFFSPFASFDQTPRPETLEDYELFKINTVNFVHKRNDQVAESDSVH